MVRINSSLSQICTVTSGVPQGSCLGSLLFNLFINDVTDHLTNPINAKLFADDPKICTEVSNCNNYILQTQLNNIHQWSQTWQMKIAHTKCNILTIGRTTDRTQYVINTNPICKVDSIKDLGVTVDRELKFNIHSSNIVQQANQRAAQNSQMFLVSAILSHLSELSKFTSALSSNMRLQHGHLRTFTKSIF